mmetsp:Transcript_33850/g.92850  ORF Transcript_33850/g.92850 Transcript_33850/m.92850 type:complete len:218 (-) Transcript_33850:114-767(-)
MEQLDEPAFGVCLLEAVQRSLQRELSLGEHRRVALALGVVLSAWWHDEIERLLEGDERHADLLHLSPFLICGHVARVDHDHQAGECLGVHAFDGIEDAADLVEARLFLERGRSEPERRRVSLFPCHSRVNQQPVTPRLAAPPSYRHATPDCSSIVAAICCAVPDVSLKPSSSLHPKDRGMFKGGGGGRAAPPPPPPPPRPARPPLPRATARPPPLPR